MSGVTGSCPPPSHGFQGSLPAIPSSPLKAALRAQVGMPFTTSPASYLLVDSKLTLDDHGAYPGEPSNLSLLAGLLWLHSGGKDTIGNGRLYWGAWDGGYGEAPGKAHIGCVSPCVPSAGVVPSIGPSQPDWRGVRGTPWWCWRYTGRKVLGAEVWWKFPS